MPGHSIPSPSSTSTKNHHNNSGEESRPTKLAKMEDSIDVVGATVKTDPIPSYRPDAKTRRYDRQLRLWASAGQRSLEQARVLLVGSDAAGSQALKNLVLPGISHFTILSPLPTIAQDVSTNFFLHPNSVGKPISEELVRYLKELNPAVEGEARTEDAAALIVSDSSFFTSFTLIICSNVDPAIESQIADITWEASSTTNGPDIPLISIRSSGFIGQVEIQLREHCIVDSHPENTHTLRIDQPFPALEQYARNLDLASMDSMEHSHVPYVILLVKAAQEWKAAHGGHVPQTDEEKAGFKKTLRAQQVKPDEENYDEAEAQSYHVWNESLLPYDLEALLNEDNVVNVSQNSKNLHILLHALKEYLKSHALPPLSPTLPDMHSSTTSYIALQTLYKSQYLSDLKEYIDILNSILERLGLPLDAIPKEEIEGFVKNSGGVGIVKGRSLRDLRETEGNARLKEAIDDHLEDEYSELYLALAEHLAFLASDRFWSTHKRWPGAAAGADLAAEQRELEEIVQTIVGKPPGSLPDTVAEAVAEIARGGFETLPTTAAFMGGLVAQEVIKLVTNQYRPLDNTVIIDLVKSTTKALQL